MLECRDYSAVFSDRHCFLWCPLLKFVVSETRTTGAQQGHKERKGSDERSRLRRRPGVVESLSLLVLFSESLESVGDFGAAFSLVRELGDE